MTRISFFGATGTVTGSKFLVEHDGFRLLLDCGLFQGLKELRERNWQPFPVPPKDIDLVVLTHAHLDHTGYLPLLAKNGYTGEVLATSASVALCRILLPDAGHIQEEDARFANKHGFARHRPALPLYTEADARRVLDRLRPAAFGTPVAVHPSITLRFLPAGHILGAAHVEVRLAGRGGAPERVVFFSGDLGRPHEPILPDPSQLPAADHLVLESTYGNRDHPAIDVRERLGQIIDETLARGGTLVIPAFAVGRTQALLYRLRELHEAGRLSRSVPIHVDSPMAVEATHVFLQHTEAQDRDMQADLARGADPLGLAGVHLVSTVEASKALNQQASAGVILSASGMATGGRVLHHLAQRLPDPRNTVLLVGFQAAGTRGRALQEGAAEIKLHGRAVPVRARVETLDGLSAHAGRGEILSWLARAERPPRRIHLVHGERVASAALAEAIRERFRLDVHEPEFLEQVRL